MALGSVGLSAMFVALLISFYIFLIGQGENPSRIVDPAGLLVQEVAISAAPGVVLAGVVFALSKSTGNKPAGYLLVVSGVVLIAGMVAAIGLLPQIHPQYLQGGVLVVPYVFIVAGAGVAGIGGYLAVTSKKSRHAGNLDDLR